MTDHCFAECRFGKGAVFKFVHRLAEGVGYAGQVGSGIDIAGKTFRGVNFVAYAI